MCASFKPQNVKMAATKRIMRDLRELEKTPVPGVGVTCPDESNPFLIHCNVLINDGPYKGNLIHLILHIPEDYPLTGPAGNIAPGLEFDSSFHGHIHHDYGNGHALCNDLLTNYSSFFRMVDRDGAKTASGWSPGYTISTALLQIVTFFADPDFHIPIAQTKIDELRSIVKSFSCSICGHTNKKPFPPVIYYQSLTTSSDQSETNDAAEKERLKLQRELREKLTCGVTKQNVFDDRICLGYPLLIRRDNRGRLWSTIILELISYDAYIAEIQKYGSDKLDFYEQAKFRSVTGQDYNHWLPVFINSQHFDRSKTLILNSISIIHSGTAIGNQRYDFNPSMALSVLTSLMNKSVVQLFNGEMYQSKHAIEAYCHFLRLLMHFSDIYPVLAQNIDKNIENFMKDLSYRNKRVIPDIGEFLIQIALSRKYQIDQIRPFLYEEYFARQIYWMGQNVSLPNLYRIEIKDLSAVFDTVKVSNHLLVFNLEMAATFIFPSVKERLDSLCGYPPEQVVDKFQQRLKKIKELNRYSDFVQAIHFEKVIQKPEDLIQLIHRSIDVSNRQGYTKLFNR